MASNINHLAFIFCNKSAMNLPIHNIKVNTFMCKTEIIFCTNKTYLTHYCCELNWPWIPQIMLIYKVSTLKSTVCVHIQAWRLCKCRFVQECLCTHRWDFSLMPTNTHTQLRLCTAADPQRGVLRAAWASGASIITLTGLPSPHTVQSEIFSMAA